MNEDGGKGTGGVEMNWADADGGRTGGVEANGVNWSSQGTSSKDTSRPDASEVTRRWEGLCDKVIAAVSCAGRKENAVSILLAAKFQEPERAAITLRAGGSLIDHNYIQQSKEGERALTELGAPFHRVYVVGHIQANGAGKATRAVGCIETVDPPELVTRLDRLQDECVSADELRKDGSPLGPFDVMIQVNSAGPESQRGMDPSSVVDLAGAVADLLNLRLVGPVLIDMNTDNAVAVAASYVRVRELRGAVQAASVASCTELSTGTMGDMGIVIAEGSTEV